jgi:hypothetical protein
MKIKGQRIVRGGERDKHTHMVGESLSTESGEKENSLV